MRKRALHLKGFFLFSLAFLFALGLVGTFLTSEACAQIRPAMVRNVDEPARVPYFHTRDASCPYGNLCEATFPTVPAGKRLRVTSISVFWRNETVSAFMALDVNTSLNPVLIFPVSPTPFAYYGNCYAKTQEVDYYFEAGQAPVLEMGTGGTFNKFNTAHLTVTGYIVDTTP